jgi:hypothetical protein
MNRINRFCLPICLFLQNNSILKGHIGLKFGNLDMHCQSRGVLYFFQLPANIFGAEMVICGKALPWTRPIEVMSCL